MASAAVSIAMISTFPSLNSVNPPRQNGAISTTIASLSNKTTSRVQLTQGKGNLPKVVLKSPQGSEAEVYLFGGCITSWKVEDNKDLLYVQPDAVFDGQESINGGIPHCFPQFGPGPIQQHGLAKNMNWSIADYGDAEGNPVLTLELKDSPYSRSQWDYAFQALYTITLKSKSLSTKLVITNADARPFSFTNALHTYFSVSVTGVTVKGLKGCKTLNRVQDPFNPIEGKEERELVTFPGHVDCIYLDVPNELYLDNGLGDVITIKNTNWPDAVLWNPHLTMEAYYKDFVCVENAKIGKVQLEPGQSWVAEQDMSIG